MGEENVEQRIMMSRYWADSASEWSPVVGPVTVGIDEAEGKDQTTFAFKNLGEETFHITADFDERTLRKIIGLPAIPTKKPKCHKKTFKKALMAYGIKRNDAEIVCKTIGQRSFCYPYSYYDCYTKIFTLLGK